jgi:hypothetical protein
VQLQVAHPGGNIEPALPLHRQRVWRHGPGCPADPHISAATAPVPLESRIRVITERLPRGDATMASHFEGQEALEAAVAGIPAIAEFIAVLPDRQRPIAFDAVERQYLQTARDWGSSEEAARTWVSAMMCHLRERIEQTAEPGIISFAGDRPNGDYNLAEKVLTRATGALALLVVSPLIALVWVGLKLERPGPAIAMRMTRGGSVEAYQFALGSGWVSRFVRRADLEAIPMMWHLLNGDDVLRFKGFAEILRGSRLRRPKSLNEEGRVDQDTTDRCRDDPD